MAYIVWLARMAVNELKLAMDRHITELIEFLKIPSVSGEEEHLGDIRKAAMFLKKKLESLNFKSEILETSTNPVVYGENLSAGEGKPTVLVYGH